VCPTARGGRSMPQRERGTERAHSAWSAPIPTPISRTSRPAPSPNRAKARRYGSRRQRARAWASRLSRGEAPRAYTAPQEATSQKSRTLSLATSGASGGATMAIGFVLSRSGAVRARQQNRDRGQSEADPADDQDRLALGETARQQAVVQVVLIRLVNRLAIAEPAQDDEGGVKDRHAQDEQ